MHAGLVEVQHTGAAGVGMEEAVATGTPGNITTAAKDSVKDSTHPSTDALTCAIAI